MRKILFLALLITLASPTLAQNAEFSLDAPPDANFMGQKQISDQDFEKTMKHLESKQKKNKKKKFKGTSLKQEDDISKIKELSEEFNILNLPVGLILEDGTEISSGHYKAVGKRTRQDTIIELHQGYAIVAKIPVSEVLEDFNEKGVCFAKILPYSQHQVRLIYGSIDFNASVILNIADYTQ